MDSRYGIDHFRDHHGQANQCWRYLFGFHPLDNRSFILQPNSLAGLEVKARRIVGFHVLGSGYGGITTHNSSVIGLCEQHIGGYIQGLDLLRLSDTPW